VRASRPKRRRLRSLTILLGAVALLGFIIIGAAEALNLNVAVGDLQAGASDLERASANLGQNPAEWTQARITAAESDQAAAGLKLGRARARLHGDPLLQWGLALPRIGDQLQTAIDLADAAGDASAALGDFIAVAKIYDASRGAQGLPGPNLIHVLETTAPLLEDADAHLSRALTTLRRDLKRPLAAQLASRLNREVESISRAQSEAAAAAGTARNLPKPLGSAAPRTYLLLFANPAELRPAGGFAGTVGVITVAEGTVTKLEIHSQDYYNTRYKQSFDIPYPLARHFLFFRNSLEMGDAGWDPDFPSSARLIEEMYRSATGLDVDGTISVDPYTVSALLGVTGPVAVPGYGTFDAGNFFTSLNFIVNVSRAPGAGKEALNVIAPVLVSKLQAQPVDRWSALLGVFREQAVGRHLQLFLHDPNLAGLAAQARFDGALLPAVNDYLMVVDGNVCASKGDYYLRKSMQLKVEVYPSGLTRHELVVRYESPLPVDDVDRALNPRDGSYGDYVRVYLPETATPSGFSFTMDGKAGDGGLERVSIEHGKKVVGAYFNLPRGHTAEMRLAYDVGLAGNGAYHLQLQKQAGVPGLPADLQISYPGAIAKIKVGLAHDEVVSFKW
jgi:hypothetical protein